MGNTTSPLAAYHPELREVLQPRQIRMIKRLIEHSAIADEFCEQFAGMVLMYRENQGDENDSTYDQSSYSSFTR